MTPVETSRQIDAAFGRGDVPAILDHQAEDVGREYGAFPNPVPWQGQVQRFRHAVGSWQHAMALQGD